MLTSMPHVEDGAPGRKTAPGIGRPPPGEDGIDHPVDIDEVENAAQKAATGDIQQDDVGENDDFNEKPTDAEFLAMVREAESQAQFYSNQINRRAWERAYKAYRQQHFDGSKYTTPDFKNRSRLFIPKTRSAVRKDLAATRASLFGSLDAITCAARQRIRSAPARVCLGHAGVAELPHRPIQQQSLDPRGSTSRWARGRPR
jgi:hypothetical protein